MDDHNLNEWFDKLTIQWLVSKPVFGGLFSGLPKQAQQIDVPCSIDFTTQGHPVFIYQPDLLNALISLSGEEMIGDLILHNLVHLILGHIDPVQRRKDPLIFDIWADFQVARILHSPSPILSYLNLYPCKNNIRSSTSMKYYLQEASKTDINLAIRFNYLCMRRKNGIPSHAAWPKYLPNKYVNTWVDEFFHANGKLTSDALFVERHTLLSKPPWQTIMRQIIHKKHWKSKKMSKKKKSKRYPGSMGLKSERKPRILIALDTSASVQTYELNYFLSEVDRISSFCHEVKMIEADYKVRQVSAYHRKENYKLVGGGSTNLEPAIQYYLERQHHYGHLFYFTDGQSQSPTCPIPPELTWVITLDGKSDHLPGRVIQL